MASHFIYKHAPAAGLGERSYRRPFITGSIGAGVPVIAYALFASSQQKERSKSSFEQLLLQSSNEMSMLVGTLTLNQMAESAELDVTQKSSRSSTDSSSTMDSMTESSHEHSQVADSSEPATEASSEEYDETQESLNKAERIETDG